jgi:hypothetical protein
VIRSRALQSSVLAHCNRPTRLNADVCSRSKGITPICGGARSDPVETDRPGTATVAAGRCDYSRAVDDTLRACKAASSDILS